MLITIVTPTIGSPYLKDLLKSINEQDGLNSDFTIEHFIVVDNAPIHTTQVNTIINQVHEKKGVQRYIFNIPFGSGENNYKGHKIYSAIPQFANGKYIIFLDDDNFMKNTHILTFINMMKENDYDWIYSLRAICDKNNKIVCTDYCESLGYLNHVFYNPNSYLIDTNCYCVKSEIVKQVCHIWNKQAQYNDNDPDRMFGKILMSNFKKYICTKKDTLVYRTIEDNKGVSAELFKNGNNKMYEIYKKRDIVTLPTIFLIHFDQKQTERMIQRIYSYSKDTSMDSIAYKQWQLNLFDTLGAKLHIKNAYTAPFIPSNSIIWIHMCDYNTLPKNILERKDLYKILYTIESPNIRHQAQWDKQFLENNFDIIMTYWTDLFKVRTENTIYFPFIHRYDFNNENDMKLITHKEKIPSACILLENRDFKNNYKINDTTLEANDYKRIIAVQNIAKYMKVYCYGASWKKVETEINKKNNNQNVISKETPSRFLDSDKTIDYYEQHTFSIILENCNASGYVSEKIYDAWSVSSIPIYYGNFNEKLKEFIGNDIPIEKMMIDLNKIGVENIGTYISELYNDDIEEIIETINKYKKIVLEKVSVNAYNEKVLEIVNTIIN